MQRLSVAPTEAAAPQIRRLLRERIIRGDLAPGARLSEAEIAGEHAVSRQPVREAFIKLAEEGLLDIRPQRGSFVRRISIPTVLSARFMREAIEADLVRLASKSPDKDALAALDALLQAQRKVLDEPDSAAFIALDDAFHRRLAEAAGQEGAWEMMDGLKTQMVRVRHLSARRFPRAKLIAQHEAIIDAMRAADPDAAEAAMRAHLREILNDLPEVAAALPDYFENRGPADLGTAS
jgi:DNA-binding GntR family transcriptional regulator